MLHKLYPHQLDVIGKVRQAFIDGARSVLLYAPCGAGKTEMAISFMHSTKENGKKSTMVLDRVVLCDQTSKRLDKYDLHHGVLQSGHWRYRPDECIQIASAQTLEARGSFPDTQLLIVDECHAVRKTTAEFIKATKSKVRTIGLSASPFTAGMAGIYDAVVSSITMAELIEMGYQCPLRVYISHQIDMTDAKKTAGEWQVKEATERGIKITGDIVSEWINKTTEIFGEPRKTIVFCAGVAHGEDLSAKFAEAGYNFVCLSYKDDGVFKQEVIDDFSKHDTKIHGLIATDILTKGFDCPDVEIMVSARPFTKSFSSHVQQLGRGMRPFPEKKFCVLLDHSGNYLRFQEDWDDLYFNGVACLKEGKVEKAKREPSKEEKEAAQCPSCRSLWQGKTDTCAVCGFVHAKRNEVVALAGEMRELNSPKTPPKKEKKREYTMAEKQDFYSQALQFGDSRGHKEGRAAHLYREKFGVWPRNMDANRMIPQPEFLAFIQHLNIKKAKGRQ